VINKLREAFFIVVFKEDAPVHVCPILDDEEDTVPGNSEPSQRPKSFNGFTLFKTNCHENGTDR